LGRNDLTGRSIVPVYINPESLSIQENKIINETLTKGGYSIQYWGEQLGEIQASGTTGSGGIEAINILRSVYRNEITQFNNILLERAFKQEQTAQEAIQNSSNATVGFGIQTIIDEFTQEGFSNIIDGTKSVIEEITNAARGLTEENPLAVELIPSIGSFAVNMILYWHGEKFMGYFKNFRVDENASKPGLFDYQFSFTITKRSGARTNFMPWHRNPYDANGIPISASIPPEGSRTDELTFKTTTQQDTFGVKINPNSPNNNNSLSSNFTESQSGNASDINQVPINRNRAIRGR
jgi:hypothetical protein